MSIQTAVMANCDNASCSASIKIGMIPSELTDLTQIARSLEQHGWSVHKSKIGCITTLCSKCRNERDKFDKRPI